MHRIVLLLSTVLLVSADLDGCELVVDQHAQNFDRFIASSASSTEGLNSFHLHTNDCTDTANNKRLVVSHSPSRKGPCTTKYTPCGLLDHRNIEYFDRHTLDCGSGQVMTEYKLERCDADNMRFRYVCCEYYEERGPTMLRHTDCDEVQGKRLEYLDRHPVACPYPAVLSHFQMLSWEQTCVDVGNHRGSSNPGGYRRFRYTCIIAPVGGVECNTMSISFGMERIHGLGGSVLSTQGLAGFSFTYAPCQDDTSRSITLTAIDIAPLLCRAESTTACSPDLALADIGEHDVDCGYHYHLTGFEFTSDGCTAGSMRIKYTCCSPDDPFLASVPIVTFPPALPTQFSSCFAVQGPNPQKNFGNIWGVQCGADQALQRWQMVGGCADTTNRRIEYVCRTVVFGPM